jgi:hypothetical protein
VEAVKLETESVETLQSTLEALVRERQQLRSSAAGQLELERNRQAIIRQQAELGAALIARYCPQHAA